MTYYPTIFHNICQSTVCYKWTHGMVIGHLHVHHSQMYENRFVNLQRVRILDFKGYGGDIQIKMYFNVPLMGHFVQNS